MQNLSKVLDILTAFNSEEDGTYELLTKEPIEYTSGYQVSFVRPEAFTQLSVEEWDILTTYCCDFLDSKAHIGVYGGDKEVSFHAMSLSDAEIIMNDFNQESILNWEKKTAFPEDFTHWFIMNPNYDEKKSVNYHEILERVQ